MEEVRVALRRFNLGKRHLKAGIPVLEYYLMDVMRTLQNQHQRTIKAITAEGITIRGRYQYAILPSSAKGSRRVRNKLNVTEAAMVTEARIRRMHIKIKKHQLMVV